MRRSSTLLTILVVLSLASTVGCKKLLDGLKKGEDAGNDAAAVATADPTADASTPADTATAASPTPKAAAPTTTAKIPKCAKDESFVELVDDGKRLCVKECIDPACDCKMGVTVLATGKLSTAPGDRRTFCPKAKAAAVKLPKCGAGLTLVTEGEGSPPFCAKGCGGDNDCKPAKCDDQGFLVDDKTGEVFTGVGKSMPICGKGFATAATSASAASSSTVLAIPPGAPGVIQNPNNQPCPAGYSNAGGVLKTCNKKCENGAKCPAGTKCHEALLVCK
jgi:hypothetical protein